MGVLFPRKNTHSGQPSSNIGDGVRKDDDLPEGVLENHSVGEKTQNAKSKKGKQKKCKKNKGRKN